MLTINLDLWGSSHIVMIHCLIRNWLFMNNNKSYFSFSQNINHPLIFHTIRWIRPTHKENNSTRPLYYTVTGTNLVLRLQICPPEIMFSNVKLWEEYDGIFIANTVFDGKCIFKILYFFHFSFKFFNVVFNWKK